MKDSKAYHNVCSHKVASEEGKSECSMENMETSSQELEVSKNKKIKITLEFPYKADPRDVKQFEHMLKSIYLNKIQTGSLQKGLSAVPFPSPNGKTGKCETSSQGGIGHE